MGGDSPAIKCSSISAFTRGVWYLVRGDNRCYTASTEGSVIDTVLTVYNTTVGCDALSCLAENDDTGSNRASRVYWTATDGLDYYILVAGFADESGQYTLSVTVSQHNVLLDLFVIL